MVWTYELSHPAPTQHSKTSESTILGGYSVGTLHDGTYVDTTSPTDQLGHRHNRFHPLHQVLLHHLYPAISTTSSMSTNTTMSTDTTMLTQNAVDLISATLDTIWSSAKDGQQWGHKNLWLRPQPTLARRSWPLRQSEDQWAHHSQIQPSHKNLAWHWGMWSFVIATGCTYVSTSQQSLASEVG